MLPGHYGTPPYPIDLYTAYRHLHHHHIPMLTPFHISIPGMAIGAPPGVTPLQYYPLYYPPGIPYNYPLHDRSRLVVSPPQREKGKELSEVTIEITQENKAEEIATNEVEKEQEADDNKHVNTTKNIKLHDSETEEDDEEEDEDEEYEDVTDDTSENDENSELKLTTDHPKCLESQSSLARDGKSIKKLDGAANARFEPPRKRKRMVKYSPDVQAEIDKMKMQDAKRFLGVNYHVLSRKFRSRIKILHKTTHLGYYETSQRAAMGYDLAAIILRGEGAKTNYYVAEYADLRDELAQIPGSPRTRCLTAARIPMEGEFGERNMTLRRVMIKKYRRKAKQPELDEGMKSR